MKVYVFSFLLFFGILNVIHTVFEFPESSRLQNGPLRKAGKSFAADAVLKSEDGGLTWRETDEEVPENLKAKENGGRHIVESGAAVFTGSSYGLYKSYDKGRLWKKVYAGGWARELAGSDSVLMATSQHGIIRSTDEGETWENVMDEGGVGIALESIEGGFAAITYNTESKTRRVRTSYDGGKTWQAIDAGLPASSMVSSIVEAGGYLFCGHPDGIFKSADKGKTWQLVVPSENEKVYNLSVSKNVVYAVPKSGAC